MTSKEPVVKRIPINKNNNNKKGNLDDIPIAEQERIINQSGLLAKAKQREQELKRQELDTSTAQYIWQAIFLSIPFGFLLAAFDITVKVQFDEPWDYYSLGIKAVKSAPALAPMIYLTNRYKQKTLTQIIMMLGSLLVGSFLLYTLHHSPSLGQMLRSPGLATLWVYFIIQLDLVPAVLSLMIVGLYYYFGLKQK
ncbi:hypothetical protein BJ944DRAFT_270370 [Cunninghamella echinulata]|nr:hypothetical protein BJ944DRAFT_270370 [Cunninghamella echinulata]